MYVQRKKHKKVFPDVPVVGFRNGKSLKDYLVRVALPKTNETRRCEPCGKKTCLACNSIRTTTTFTTEASGENFRIQSGPLNCNSEKVLCLLKCKACGEAPYVGKAKTKFDIGSTTIKANIELSGKKTEKYPRNLFTIITVQIVIQELITGILLFSSNVRHINN